MKNTIPNLLDTYKIQILRYSEIRYSYEKHNTMHVKTNQNWALHKYIILGLIKALTTTANTAFGTFNEPTDVSNSSELKTPYKILQLHPYLYLT